MGIWENTSDFQGPLFGRVANLPLLPLLQEQPNSAPELHQVEVSGTQELELRWDPSSLPPTYRNNKPIVWLKGFSLEPGPLHESTGVTPVGLQWNTELIAAESGRAIVKITVAHQAGTVPDRTQKLDRFSAFARTQLGIVFLPSGSETPRVHRQSESFESPFRILHEPSGPIGFGPRPEVSPSFLQLWRGFHWSVDGPQSKHPGRYVREIRLQSQMTAGESRFSPAGDWTRATQGQIGVDTYDFSSLPNGSRVTLSPSIEASDRIKR